MATEKLEHIGAAPNDRTAPSMSKNLTLPRKDSSKRFSSALLSQSKVTIHGQPNLNIDFATPILPLYKSNAPGRRKSLTPSAKRTCFFENEFKISNDSAERQDEDEGLLGGSTSTGPSRCLITLRSLQTKKAIASQTSIRDDINVLAASNQMKRQIATK